MAVLAPIPRARVRTATAEKTGAFRMCHNAEQRSCNKRASLYCQFKGNEVIQAYHLRPASHVSSPILSDLHSEWLSSCPCAKPSVRFWTRLRRGGFCSSAFRDKSRAANQIEAT